MDNTALVNDLAAEVENAELEAIREVRLIERLRANVSVGEENVRRFGRFFHPVRYSFVHVNFIVGARQEMHEVFWGGLARNLFEELGGGVTPAHNELYREFLRSVGVPTDRGIEELDFSKRFNNRWRTFANSEPIEDAVLSVAVYEILDRPDYASLFKSLDSVNPGWALEFFRIHSLVEHFDMFSEFVAWYFANVENAQNRFERVKEFVLSTQRDMWLGLLSNLETVDLDADYHSVAAE